MKVLNVSKDILDDGTCVSGKELARLLLRTFPGSTQPRSPWHAKCEIIVDYVYPNSKTDRPRTVIRYNDGSEHPPFLRHSAGPLQGFFWDIYGDDFQSVELALLALAQAPVPVNVGPITFTIPLANRQEKS